MAKKFNVAADCKPDLHYMVKLDSRLAAIKGMVDAGDYFTINRARQYGKTTILRALNRYLQGDYHVVLMDFQTISNSKFENEESFCLIFLKMFLQILRAQNVEENGEFCNIIGTVLEQMKAYAGYELTELFMSLSDICAASDKPIVLMIDEVDSATNNQVFLDFLAQMRAGYINRDVQPTFQSVILAGVHDVKNIRRKMRPDEEHKVNSPWNIAVDFNVDMSFSAAEITVMLLDYEAEHETGMDVSEMAGLIFDYTSGYPFLVSRLCKLIDEMVYGQTGFETKAKCWTKQGFLEAMKLILTEKNTLFESMSGKMYNYPEMRTVVETILFTGKSIAYNADNILLDTAIMYGFVKNERGRLVIANRIFETRLYNLFLSNEEWKQQDIYTASLRDKNQFVMGKHLNVQRILERFVVHFHDLYGNSTERFIEEEGRKYFLLYLRPIINGVGNYYIEARTRDLRRTDIIIDYLGEQHIIEMKIWHGEEYNSRGEEQLLGYLEDYHLNKGYMLSFNFNKHKQIGVQEHVMGDKVLIEAVV